MRIDVPHDFLVVSLEMFDLGLDVLELALAVFVELLGEEGLSHDVVEFAGEHVSLVFDVLDLLPEVIDLLSSRVGLSVSLLQGHFLLGKIIILVQK